MYGILEINLTEELLREIVAIYDKVVGARAAERLQYYPPDYMISHVKRRSGNAVEWRFGSRLTINSKFFVWEAGCLPVENDGTTDWRQILRFSFDPNMSSEEVPGSTGDQLNQEFVRRVDELLLAKELAVPVRR